MIALVRKVRYRLAACRKVCTMVPDAVSLCGGSWCVLLRRVRLVYAREGMRGVWRRAWNMPVAQTGPQDDKQAVAFCRGFLEHQSGYEPRVSIIVPCYNHAPYLRRRLDSIYGQSYGNIEVILLDDCSTDGSVEILREYAERHAGVTTLLLNSENSGGVFHQWKKGFAHASGELVWIAESDDFCSENMLAELVPFFAHDGVQLAFARTDFVRGGAEDVIWTSEEYLADLALGDWKEPFVRSAHYFVKNGWVVRNVIPNVSSAVFRRPQELALLDDPAWINLRMCGDWVFYLAVARGGFIAFTPLAVNAYRQHDRNTSVSMQRENDYYREHEIVASYLVRMYAVEEVDVRRQREALYAYWCARRGRDAADLFRSLYSVDRIMEHAGRRKWNLGMGLFAFAAGGGETFPLFLANLLAARGYGITVLNFGCAEQEDGVRHLLHPAVPVVRIADREYTHVVIRELGLEIVHSHHAWVDISLSMALLGSDIRQIVSLHGMYEMMTDDERMCIRHLLEGRVDQFVYTAEKNLEAFAKMPRVMEKIRRIDNALPVRSVQHISRLSLGIREDDFVLCFVARSMPEKGWREALESVTWANERSTRRIHLLLIGDGEETERLRAVFTAPVFHFLGFQNSILDYFSMADMGFLPSRFKGESCPLVVIDSLQAGRPVLASNIGEIRYMLGSEAGVAGILFDLADWNIDVEALGAIICDIANDGAAYAKLLARVPLAAEKFNPDTMLDAYERVYADSVHPATCAR